MKRNPPSLPGLKPRPVKLDLVLLSVSILLQLTLAAFLGHAYDMRIFMATGYLVGNGHNPYIMQDLSAVFHNTSFQGITTIGYPPPWALVLGIIYLVSYRIIPNFLLYNLVIKLPIIAANIGMAYLVAGILKKLGVEQKKSHAAWVFMLFNPLLLITTSAWGQFDSIVALLVLLSLFLVWRDKLAPSAILLGLTVAFKPTALPVILAVAIYLYGKSWKTVLLYLAILIVSLGLFCVVPFIVFHWDPSPILQNWNAHFAVGGGMSFMTFLEFFTRSYQLPAQGWFLGWLWVPALLAAGFMMRKGEGDLKDLLVKSMLMILVFFLCRAWLSEPNIILLLPFVVILASLKFVDSFSLHAVWILPLVFAIFNTALIQLLFPILPGLMDQALQAAGNFASARLIAQIIVVLLWLVVGWRLVIKSMSHPSELSSEITS